MALSEFELIQRYFAPFNTSPAVVAGIGDDCAVLALSPGSELCTSIDTMVESVHFPANADPHGLGWRCLAAAVSDLAACGARPVGFCLALTLPDVAESWLAAFASGLAAAAEAFAIPLVGGDTTRGPLTLSVQVMGEVASGGALLRSGAKAGDQIWVSGSLGEGRAALDYLDQPSHANPFSKAYYYPRPPLQFGCELAGIAHSAIDISDGLLADLGHILQASGVGAEIDITRLPVSNALITRCGRERATEFALSGGDDYQLCFTSASASSATLQALALKHEVQLTCIGHIREQSGILCRDAQGKLVDPHYSGYRHFS